MNASPVAVGVVQPDDLSSEQAAAYDWCRGAVAIAEQVTPAALADGRVDPDRFDVLWWHADEAPDDDVVEAAAVGVQAHLRAGGGLLLTLKALAAVETLGIDPVPPDSTGIEDVHDSSGPLWKAVHADHAAFEGFDDLRTATLPPGVHPFARYDDILPQRGEVLAATFHGEDDHPHWVSTVAWPSAGAVGDEADGARGSTGPVVGMGAGLRFDVGEHHAAARSTLAGNLLAVLADGPEIGIAGRPRTAEELRAARDRLDETDRHRPAYHISPPGNWLNDPNGLLHHEGTYHVFYQYNPGGPNHRAIHWGHASSDDLVTWDDEPVALTPSPDGPDRDGCWSGCAVDDGDGPPRVLYTGGRGRDQLPCLATAVDDDLVEWEKADDNPIVEAPPADLDVLATEHWAAEFRDHAVWREDGTWYQLIGSGIRGVGGAALLYESGDDDLADWEYVAPLLVGDWEGSGDVWECPELLRFEAGDVLHVSDYENVTYFLGEADLAAGSFEVDSKRLLDHGDLYAPQSLRAPDGRYLTWGWIVEGRSEAAQWDAGWSGVLSVPRVLDVRDGELYQRPARELEQLREERIADVAGKLASEETTSLARGDSVEITASIRLGDADAVEVDVLSSPVDHERTTLRLTGGALTVDRSASSHDPAADGESRHVPLPESSGPRELRVFVDRSVVEVFVDETRCLSTRVYPSRTDSDRIAVQAVGGRATVESLSVWRLAPGW